MLEITDNNAPPANPFDPETGPATQPPPVRQQPRPQPPPGYKPRPAPLYQPPQQFAGGNGLNDDSIVMDTLPPFNEEAIRSTFYWDILLNGAEHFLVVHGFTLNFWFGLIIFCWFLFIFVQSILARQGFSNTGLGSQEKRMIMQKYSGYRSCNTIVLWVLWALYLVGFFLLFLITSAVAPNQTAKENSNALIFFLLLFTTVLMVGHAVYSTKTQKNIIVASLQA